MPSIPQIREIIVDTGFWVALGNQRDTHHPNAVSWLKSHIKVRLITTWPVVVETCYLLSNRAGPMPQQLFLRLLENPVIQIFDLSKPMLGRLQQLMDKYADLPMDLADGSLVLLAEQLGHGNILSTDQRNFQTYRWKNHTPFNNLFLPDI